MKKIITVICTALLATLMALSTSVIASEKKTLQHVILDSGLATAALSAPAIYGPIDVSGFREVRIYVHSPFVQGGSDEGVVVEVMSDVGGSPVYLDSFVVVEGEVASLVYSVMGPAITIEVSEAAGSDETTFTLVLFGSL